MHIADGIIPVAACVAAHGVALPAVYLLGRKIEVAEISRMGLLASAAFVVSLIHFPVGGASIHLGLFGLLGLLLGKRAFPVIYAVLLFQTLLFQHGGLLSLGLNAVNMGTGAIVGWGIWSLRGIPMNIRGFAAGFLGTLIPAFLMAAEFSLSGYGRGFYFVASVYSVAAAIEGGLTVAIIEFFQRAKPEALATA